MGGARGVWVIPFLRKQFLGEHPFTQKGPKMPGFMMAVDAAVVLFLYVLEPGNKGEFLVKKAPAATIVILAKAVAEILKRPDHPIKVIGTRHGEKVYETLMSREEMVGSEDLGNYFRIRPDMRDLNYGKFFEEGESKLSSSDDYNSHNTTRLDVEGMKKLLMKLDFMRDLVAGKTPQTVD